MGGTCDPIFMNSHVPNCCYIVHTGFHLEGGWEAPPPPPPQKKEREKKGERDRQREEGGGQCIFGYYDDYCSYINRILAEQSNQL